MLFPFFLPCCFVQLEGVINDMDRIKLEWGIELTRIWSLRQRFCFKIIIFLHILFGIRATWLALECNFPHILPCRIINLFGMLYTWRFVTEKIALLKKKMPSRCVLLACIFNWIGGERAKWVYEILVTNNLVMNLALICAIIIGFYEDSSWFLTFWWRNYHSDDLLLD